MLRFRLPMMKLDRISKSWLTLALMLDHAEPQLCLAYARRFQRKSDATNLASLTIQ
jgi:hypothetical protein